MAANGAKTLVVSLSNSHLQEAAPPSARRVASVIPSAHGYDILPCFDAEGQPVDSNAFHLREAHDKEFAGYERIILDLPPVLDQRANDSSALALAPLCERILMVCVIGETEATELSEAVSLLRGAGGIVSGIISNEYAVRDPWRLLNKLRRSTPRSMQPAG